MHDEFSAVFRTNFLSFRELVEKGVKPDGHPAGIQVFLYYWIKLFGSNEWVVKLPFTIMGMFSVLLIYLLAKRWYNETVGLITAAFLASIQYTIMYSQIARPYISGLFFSLSMVYYWSKLMDPNNKIFWKNAGPYIIASALCAYNHHFSLLFAAIVGISGMFIIPRKLMLRYILCGLLIFMLYIPHLGIFMAQFKTGGVGGWLAKPENYFLIDYLYYIFHYSFAPVFLTLGLIVFGLVYFKKRTIRINNYVLFFSWFLIPLLIGFLYSVKINPVLQYSVLIFSFYPLLFLFFGHIPEQKANTNFALVLVILLVNTYTLINERKHYSLFYNSAFERIVTDYEDIKENNRNFVPVVDSNKRITQYYIAKHKADSAFIKFDSFNTETELTNFLREKSKTYNYLYLGAMSSIKPNTIPIIRQFFPVMQAKNNYFLGSTYLFSKKGADERKIAIRYGFEVTPPEGWSLVNNDKIVRTTGFNDSFSYRMDSLTEWSPTFAAPVSELISHENNYIDVLARVRTGSNITEALLIATLESEDGVVHFSGADFKPFSIASPDSNEWYTVIHSLKLSDMNLDFSSLMLKVFIWNKGKNNFLINEFLIEIREGNPVLYGLYEKIPD